MGFLPEVIEISVQSGSSYGFVEQQWNSVQTESKTVWMGADVRV